MVCLADDDTVRATVIDTTGAKTSQTVILSPTKTVESVLVEVGSKFNYNPDVYEFALQQRNGHIFVLNDFRNKTFAEIPDLELSGRISIVLSLSRRRNISLVVNDNADDDLILGASASPTMGEAPSSSGEAENKVETLALMNVGYYSRQPKLYLKPEPCSYVGLVNQAMTCYLNSLLQALFMTPEFRNALYNWEFDGQNQEKSIPFQLQKLFLNLQTSIKSAVETTDLTHSFGWDLQAAWEQHDIQELCRVMFDALEQTFKNTKQSNLINDLYEGKMLDYVKCLECSTEKSREDTFLDIPLPVRPFGSSVAYTSIEEALRGFVQPETLEGNNQYFCEKCNKKCDAHKGLKFIKFPYLLTLHLKRFDFVYTTMHRIKLNDKVVFPEVLNLNSFIPNVISMLDDASEEREIATTKYDDCSTTDSGSALDDESCHGTDVSSTVNGQDGACQDDDEGIDVSSGNHSHENEKNRLQEQKGPYIYELFSIMIHSGSASGGHYYAYIKDFSKDHWFCFNDQSVSRITEDDIHKTYGGGPPRGYYSGAYTSSTNAYMLMYRQIDKNRNCHAMTVNEFPSHIQTLLKEMREKEEIDRLAKEKEIDMLKMKVYCVHPISNQLFDMKLFGYAETTLYEMASDAYDRFKLKGVVNFEDCRLVTYNNNTETLEKSFESDSLRLCDIDVKDKDYLTWFLEIRQPGQAWEAYFPGGVKMKVYLVHFDTEEISGPNFVRVNPGKTTGELKKQFASMFGYDVDSIKIIMESGSNNPIHLDEDDVPIKYEPRCSNYKLYVASVMEEDVDKEGIINKMQKVIDLFVHIVNIDVILPDNDISTLESLSIPPLDLNQNMDDGLNLTTTDRELYQKFYPKMYPSQTTTATEMDGFGDQSNSEDSSLSDSDRTLIGDAPAEGNAYINTTLATLIDPTVDTYDHEVFDNPSDELPLQLSNDDVVMQECEPNMSNYYFKVVGSRNIEPTAENGNFRCYMQIMLDARMSIGRLKKHLEPLIGVPVQYFKIFKEYQNQNVELTNLNESLNLMKDGERLIVKLGRVLRKNEMSGKVFLLTPDGVEPFTFLFECIVAKGQSVLSVKKDILLQAKKQHMLDLPPNKCRIRRKEWKTPSKIYLDDQKFVDDITISTKFEIFVQELTEPEKIVHPDQMVAFIKRWFPATLQLGNFQEIVLDEPTVEELKRKISNKSGIPEEFVDVVLMKQPHTFPCDMNVLEVDNLEWNSNSLDTYSLKGRDDDCIIFYRDSREQLKELSPEERKELHQKENMRLGKSSTKMFSPSRRERGLKIYLDNTMSMKMENNPVD
nr:ubiquitin carboxyl-terminal hydrolase 47 [Onthophagus taurus]XP_022915817.1 ubiquitin carboxyl-terminal hydrolase 47 [Onthophagus taurus]XP_022915818.1 ubiquitin carboxyl-terminal hydrolase 47 [Onthophagus taurus]